jgi:hypothetical protein
MGILSPMDLIYSIEDAVDTYLAKGRALKICVSARGNFFYLELVLDNYLRTNGFNMKGQ